jgi:hypothetical protein
MIVPQELRALRRDDSPQRDAQRALGQAMEQWRARPDIAAILAELSLLAEGAPISRCPRLAGLFDPRSPRAGDFAGEQVRLYCAMLRKWPLGHVPLRHFTDGVTSTLLVARCGNATLSLVSIDGDGLSARPQPLTVSFAPTETWECVVAGEAVIDMVTCEPTGPRAASIARREMRVAPGATFYRQGLHETRVLREVSGALVSLRLQRRRRDGALAREYDLESGALVHQAAGNPRESRLELAMALLGRIGRSDAAPLMADIACGNRSGALRWQALRECLALDTRTGFAALSALAARPGDALAAPAGALRAQLLEAHPQLQEIASCPA